MADEEFEEFWEPFPSTISLNSNYTLLPGMISPIEENTISFLEKVKIGEKLCGINSFYDTQPSSNQYFKTSYSVFSPSVSKDLFESDNEIGKVSIMNEINETKLENHDNFSLTNVDGFLCDVDSGNSTNHSPGEVSSSEIKRQLSNTKEIFTSLLNVWSFLEPSHRGLHKFIPRHKDEIEIEIGDPIVVKTEAEDLWCEGINLRSKRHGIFPSAYVLDVDYKDFGPNFGTEKKDRYLLNYLGSLETKDCKGNIILIQALRKIRRSELCPLPVTLEISDKGLRMTNKTSNVQRFSPIHDYFFILQNITFIGFIPFEPKYFGFVNKHSKYPRYACHIFVSETSTQHIVESFGHIFSRFSKEFMDTAYPIEDIYME